MCSLKTSFEHRESLNFLLLYYIIHISLIAISQQFSRAIAICFLEAFELSENLDSILGWGREGALFRAKVRALRVVDRILLLSQPIERLFLQLLCVQRPAKQIPSRILGRSSSSATIATSARVKSRPIRHLATCFFFWEMTNSIWRLCDLSFILNE